MYHLFVGVYKQLMNQKLLETDILEEPSFMTMQADSSNATIRSSSAEQTPLPQSISLNSWQVPSPRSDNHIGYFHSLDYYERPDISTDIFKVPDEPPHEVFGIKKNFTTTA
jgi:hypothetical protein